uniref:Uncharacterized protein n=1 Tax=Molossus molossus TaxID=27622 RepID=A0A7J8JW88_MOLMO|nr:hypothetical protein HJG59_008096 [Molossus molossus]
MTTAESLLRPSTVLSPPPSAPRPGAGPRRPSPLSGAEPKPEMSPKLNVKSLNIHPVATRLGYFRHPLSSTQRNLQHISGDFLPDKPSACHRGPSRDTSGHSSGRKRLPVIAPFPRAQVRI